MRRNKWIKCVLVTAALSLNIATAQVVAPVEIKDPELRSLQMEYMDDLKAAGSEITNNS